MDRTILNMYRIVYLIIFALISTHFIIFKDIYLMAIMIIASFSGAIICIKCNKTCKN